jgi:hypothetical protein
MDLLELLERLELEDSEDPPPLSWKGGGVLPCGGVAAATDAKRERATTATILVMRGLQCFWESPVYLEKF